MSEKTEKTPGRAETVCGRAVENRVRKHSTRRGFLRNAVIGAVAVTATAKLAQKTGSVLMPDPEYQRKYALDVTSGDGELKSRKYVVMSEREKREYVSALERSHKAKA